MAMIATKRVYDAPAASDGVRVLVDRLWPRGLRKDAARVAAWAKELAPSDALRRWFGHDPDRFGEFRARYLRELRTARARAALAQLAQRAARGTVTLVYAARDPEHNNAVVLATELRSRLRRAPGRAAARRRVHRPARAGARAGARRRKARTR